ncbi:MAG: AAA family ATPase [Candidatus Aminicenantes bacterium]|nr:AAA family ATPase [Candidatus Aminicenantes bacterium]
MFIENIEISGFRNLKKKNVFSFTNSKNIIYGPNGSGKTTILEAIYILGFGRSFLNVKKEELLNNESDEFFINSTVNRNQLKFKISASLNKSFSLFLDGEKTGIPGIGRNFFPLFFSSSDYVSLISSRSSLRKLFDRFIFGTENIYSKELIEYKKVIRNKTYLLKHNPDYAHLKGWNKLLAEYILKITRKRFDFIRKINDHVQDKYRSGIEIRYTPSSSDFYYSDDFKLDKVLSVLDGILEKEILYKSPIVGTHLDKYEIFMDNRPLRLYSSGEKKLNLIFIYLAYIDMFLSERGEYPVFLVDDYDIAMDEENTEVLMSNYPAMQIIATSVRNNKNFDSTIKLKH